jgi:hypothetical protein
MHPKCFILQSFVLGFIHRLPVPHEANSEASVSCWHRQVPRCAHFPFNPPRTIDPERLVTCPNCCS